MAGSAAARCICPFAIHSVITEFRGEDHLLPESGGASYRHGPRPRCDVQCLVRAARDRDQPGDGWFAACSTVVGVGLGVDLGGVLAAATCGLAAWEYRRRGTDAAPLRSGVPAELPSVIVDFFGRRKELDRLRSAARSGTAAVAVVGPPGLGKSTIAVRLAHDLRSRFPDGQLVADLGAGQGSPLDPTVVLSRFLGALGLSEADQQGDLAALSARYRSRLSGRRILVLLDDAHDAAQLRPLLPGSGGSIALITSRSSLLDLPEATVTALEQLSEPEAIRLLGLVVGDERVAAEPVAAAAVVARVRYYRSRSASPAHGCDPVHSGRWRR
jgi:hypothetical protein